MAAIPCWIQRSEADPRYDYSAGTFVMDAPGMAPNCDHERCKAEVALHDSAPLGTDLCSAESGWDCPIAECRWGAIHAMCVLDQNHPGDHHYVNEDEITLEFAPLFDLDALAAAAGEGA